MEGPSGSGSRVSPRGVVPGYSRVVALPLLSGDPNDDLSGAGPSGKPVGVSGKRYGLGAVAKVSELLFSSLDERAPLASRVGVCMTSEWGCGWCADGVTAAERGYPVPPCHQHQQETSSGLWSKASGVLEGSGSLAFPRKENFVDVFFVCSSGGLPHTNSLLVPHTHPNDQGPPMVEVEEWAGDTCILLVAVDG